MSSYYMTKNNNNDILNKQGYVLFNDILDTSQVEDAYENEYVDYDKVIKYIENEMLVKLDSQMGWKSDYIKFRASNNNNSSDASCFHRDVIPQQNVMCKSYTCLSYVDDASMELIPESHMNLFSTDGEAIDIYTNRKEIQIKKGDMLLFNSTILHRGIFTDDLAKRKLIQVFEVFPSETELMHLKDRYMHVPAKQETYAPFMQFFSSFRITGNIMNIIGYYNAVTGYAILDKKCIGNTLFLSSEGLRGRLDIYNSKNKIGLNNKYVIKHETINLPKEYYDDFNYYCYTIKYTKIIVIMILLLLLLIYVLMKMYTKISKDVEQIEI
jgi:hypothetical protein